MNNLINIEDKITSIEKTYNSALDDLKKYYILSESNPNNDEYKNFFNGTKAELQHYSQSLFNISKDIISELNNIEKDVLNKSNKLDSQKKLYAKLSKMYNELEQKQNGSHLFINDSKELYNQQYYRNLYLFIGISGLLAMLAYLAKAK